MMATGDTATSKLELIMGRDGLARLDAVRAHAAHAQHHDGGIREPR